MKPNEKCQKCKIDLSKVNAIHGSFIEGNWVKKGKWIYWCDKCKKEITPHYPC